jgi:hypothetical protein
MAEYLNPNEVSRLIAFNSDPVMREAVKKVLLFNIYNAETLKEGEPVGLDKHWVYGIDTRDSTDEEVGKRVRTKISAMSFIEDAFKTLGEYHTEIVPEEEVNQAV